MPFESVPGTDLHYYLIVFDAQGKECTEAKGDDNRRLSDAVIAQLRNQPVSDIFIISHGWKGDVPAARDQYRRWIKAMAANAADRERMQRMHPDFQLLIIGLHWPSLPWGDEELADDAGISFGMPASPASASSVTGNDELIDRYASRIADTPRARAALQTIFDAAMHDIAPRHLPEDVRKAYEILDAESRLGSEGEAGAPGCDREAFDAERWYKLARMDAVSYGGACLGGILDPLRQLSFWTMKDRARRFGESGARDLLVRIRRETPHVRIHLTGHSFGCIVVSAMLNADEDSLQPVSSLVLLQGALSVWSFCSDIPIAPGKAGYFHSVVDARRVLGPLVTTQSRYDTALSRFYPLGAGIAQQLVYETGTLPRYAAVGTYGICGIDDRVAGMDMLSADSTYDFLPGHIYNIDGSAFICERRGASGAHSDIARPEVAHLVWEAARSGLAKRTELR